MLHPYKIVIPARYQSTRMPGKMLRSIQGKPMLQHTYEKAMQTCAEEVIIAAGDKRIAQCASKFGAPYRLIEAQVANGTERVALLAEQSEWDEHTVIINLQGDEPFIEPSDIDFLASQFDPRDGFASATLFMSAPLNLDVTDPNLVKVVCNDAKSAIYFSRSPIPFGASTYRIHIGVYAYSVKLLRQYLTWGVCECEHTESLEQLRILGNGGKLAAYEAKGTAHGINTDKDLKNSQR